MAFLLSVLLFFLPTAAYLLWLRRHPGEEPPLQVMVPALAGLALGLAGLIWYALSTAEERGTAYVPARMGEDGRVVRGHAERAGPPPGAQAPPR
jgi:drug/metabolite transporter (DMT)-like permease